MIRAYTAQEPAGRLELTSFDRGPLAADEVENAVVTVEARLGRPQVDHPSRD